MAEEIKLTKTVYGKVTYPNIINTEFTQLIGNSLAVEDTPITVEQFFDTYDDLFFEIPISGDFNSHEELIKRQQTIDGLTTSK